MDRVIALLIFGFSIYGFITAIRLFILKSKYPQEYANLFEASRREKGLSNKPKGIKEPPRLFNSSQQKLKETASEEFEKSIKKARKESQSTLAKLQEKLDADTLNDDASSDGYQDLNDWKENLKLICEGNKETVEFTYQSSGGKRKRRKIDVLKLLESSDGRFYIEGFCHSRKSQRSFNLYNITSMIAYKSARYEVPEYFEKFYGLDV